MFWGDGQQICCPMQPAASTRNQPSTSPCSNVCVGCRINPHRHRHDPRIPMAPRIYLGGPAPLIMQLCKELQFRKFGGIGRLQQSTIDLRPCHHEQGLILKNMGFWRSCERIWAGHGYGWWQVWDLTLLPRPMDDGREYCLRLRISRVLRYSRQGAGMMMKID